MPVLAELMAGSTDRVACRNLRVSPRTYSRRLAELLTLIGVDTRFQCGFHLGLTIIKPDPMADRRGHPPEVLPVRIAGAAVEIGSLRPTRLA